MSLRDQQPLLIKNTSSEDIPPFSTVRVTGISKGRQSDARIIYEVDKLDGLPGMWLTTGLTKIMPSKLGVGYTGNILAVAYADDPDDLTTGHMVGGKPDEFTLRDTGMGGFRYIGKSSDVYDNPVIIVERLTHWVLRGKLDGALAKATSMTSPKSATVSLWSPTADTTINITVQNDDKTQSAVAGSLVRVVPDGKVWRVISSSCEAV